MNILLHQEKRTYYWNFGGTLEIKGNNNFFDKGTCITIGENGHFIVGYNFHLGPDSVINCYKNISFGPEASISWHYLIMYSDGHFIYQNNKYINLSKQIIVGNHILISCHSIILKDSDIENMIVLAAKSLVNKYLEQVNSIYVSNKLVKSNIEFS